MAAYARIALARSVVGWTVTGPVANPAAVVSFALMAGGAGGTVTHFGIGTDETGAGHLLLFGEVAPDLVVEAGVTPKLDTDTEISVGSMTDEAAEAFLTLLLTNIDWANIGDAGGLQNSASAGDLYLSLHTASPGVGGDQETNEISYT
jgi:hypothetical protein